MRVIKLLESERVQGREVLKANEVDDLLKAQDVVDEARAWAENRVATIEEEVEMERQAGFGSAYAEGLGEFLTAVDQLNEEKKALETRVAQMVSAGLEKVLSQLPAEDVLFDLMRPAFQSISGAQEVLVMGHPDDVTALSSALERLKDLLPEGLSASSSVDRDINPGSCMIYTENEVFKVGIPVAVEQICGAIMHEFDAKGLDHGI